MTDHDNSDEGFWCRGKVKRRTVLGYGVSAGALGATMLVPAPWQAAFGQAKAYKIGSEQPLSGAGAAGGRTALIGLEMAVDRINKMGGINGRPVELIPVDDELKPDVARRKVEKLLVEDKVDAHVGGFLSNICLACMPVFEEHKVLNMISVCLDTTLTTTRCNKYSFRPFDYAPSQAVAFAPWLVKQGKRWHIAFADYSWGQSTRDAYVEQIKKAGGEIAGTTGIPLGTADMTPFLSKITGNFDGLFGIFFGKDGVTIGNQAFDLGMTKKYKWAGDGAIAEFDQPAGARQQDRRLRRHQPLRPAAGSPAQYAASQAVLRRSQGPAQEDRSLGSRSRPLRAVELRGHERLEDRHGEVEVPWPRGHRQADRGARRPGDEGRRRLPAGRQDAP